MRNKKSASDRKRATKKRNKIIKNIFLILLCIILIFAIVVGETFFYLQKKGRDSITPDLENNTTYLEEIEYNGHTYTYNEDMISFVFVGVDRREMLMVDQTDFVGANDADIVVAINTKSGEATMIAIPRDTQVDVDIYQNDKFLGQEKTQLYLSYAYGDGAELSCQNATTSISRVLKNIPIEKYYALDLDGIAPINNSIGGVMLKSKMDMPQYDVTAGEIVTLKDDMAESYVRSRSMTDINATLDRTDRQVQYLQSFANQTFPAVLIDFGTINDLYSVGSQYSQTNMSIGDVTYMASLLLSKGTDRFDAKILEGTVSAEQDSAGEGIMHTQFTPDEDKLMQLVLDTYYLKIK